MPSKAKKTTVKPNFIEKIKKNLVPVLIISLFVGFSAGYLVKSFAATRGGHSTPSGTITLVLFNDKNADGLPNHGDTIKFDLFTSASTEPHVKLSCVQAGVEVFVTQTAYFPGYAFPGTQNITLESGAWQSGSAECTATGYYFDGRKTPTFATLIFTVNP